MLHFAASPVITAPSSIQPTRHLVFEETTVKIGEGHTLSIGMDKEEVRSELTAAGFEVEEDARDFYFTANNCDFNYTGAPSVTINSIGENKLYCISVWNASLKTNRGLVVGDDAANIEELYGATECIKRMPGTTIFEYPDEPYLLEFGVDNDSDTIKYWRVGIDDFPEQRVILQFDYDKAFAVYLNQGLDELEGVFSSHNEKIECVDSSDEMWWPPLYGELLSWRSDSYILWLASTPDPYPSPLLFAYSVIVPNIKTSKGISIGDSVGQIVNSYGECTDITTDEEKKVYRYSLDEHGEKIIGFVMSNDKIDYWFVEIFNSIIRIRNTA